jgi:ATP-grasp domain, R2K clade family 3
MNISFIYPSDPFSPKKIDEAFEKEARLIKDANFSIHIINTDDIENAKIIPVLNTEDSLIYRGWMLPRESYEKLYEKVNKQLLTSPESYLYAHHLPNWYNDLKEFTMQSRYSVGEDTKQLYKDWGNQPAFVKDYVKSLKTGSPPIISSKIELEQLMDKMKQYRGYIEGGIVLREPKELVSATETRFFVLKGQVFSKDETVSLEMHEMAQQIAQKVNHTSFFSIDLVKDTNDKVWLIEIGDGQVSDSVGWNQENFVYIFNSLKPKNSHKP